jgi:hypothetical protein
LNAPASIVEKARATSALFGAPSPTENCIRSQLIMGSAGYKPVVTER